MIKFFKAISACLMISVVIAAGVIAYMYKPEQTLMWHVQSLMPFTLLVFPFVSSVALLIFEPHNGWKRLTLILAIVLSLPLAYLSNKFLVYYPKPRIEPLDLFFGFLFTFPFVVYVMILGKAANLWIKDGFTRTKS